MHGLEREVSPPVAAVLSAANALNVPSWHGYRRALDVPIRPGGAMVRSRRPRSRPHRGLWVGHAGVACSDGRLYAVAIGENVLRAEPDSARRVRVVVGAFAQIIAALASLWLITTVIGAVARPLLLPHLAGVLMIGAITRGLGVMFGAFEFRSSTQLHQRALAILAKEERRRDLVPSDSVGGSPTQGLVGTIAGVSLPGAAATSIALGGTPPRDLGVFTWRLVRCSYSHSRPP
jgi:hypothetical protein